MAGSGCTHVSDRECVCVLLSVCVESVSGDLCRVQ